MDLLAKGLDIDTDRLKKALRLLGVKVERIQQSPCNGTLCPREACDDCNKCIRMAQKEFECIICAIVLCDVCETLHSIEDPMFTLVCYNCNKIFNATCATCANTMDEDGVWHCGTCQN